MPLLWALLPNKTAATYIELLTTLRSSLVSVYGDIGSIQTIPTDFEMAAMKAIAEVFPETRLKGCSVIVNV